MNLGWTVVRWTDFLAQLRSSSSSSSRPVVIAVNGHSSSGKTTLGRRLVASLGSADVLHTDDLAWHQGVFAWDELLVADVLPVVRAGDPLRYRPPQWQARGREGAIELRGGLEFLVVEGVGASQPSVRRELDLVIWVETDEPTRAARNAARVAAGEDSPSGYRRWMAEENAHVIAYEPWRDADLLVDGGDSHQHDRHTEIVVSRA